MLAAVDGETLLLHQSHPAKIAVDVSASAISGLLLWRRHLLAGATVRYLLPVAGSIAVLSLADLSRHRERRAGRYVLEHMPPGAQVVRLAGDLVMALGCWHRRPRLIAVGSLLVLAGWAHGLVLGAPPAARLRRLRPQALRRPGSGRRPSP